jgi:hypothetical protein
MEDNIKRQEEAQEPREEVLAMYNRYRKLFSDAKSAITEIYSNVTALDESIKLRREGYKLILRCTCKGVSRQVPFCLFLFLLFYPMTYNNNRTFFFLKLPTLLILVIIFPIG